MTWGRMVDTRRTLTRIFLIILLAILTLFACVSLLVSTHLLAPTPMASELISVFGVSL
jgi:hypothetical protein